MVDEAPNHTYEKLLLESVPSGRGLQCRTVVVTCCYRYATGIATGNADNLEQLETVEDVAEFLAARSKGLTETIVCQGKVLHEAELDEDASSELVQIVETEIEFVEREMQRVERSFGDHRHRVM